MGDNMSINSFIPNNIDFFESESNFKKSFPFKIYELKNGRNSGDTTHTHDYMQVWYICRGVCNHWINGKEHKMVKGDIFVLPPYVVHKVRPVKGEDIHIIGCEFSARFFNDKFNDFVKDREFFDFAYLEPFMVSEEMVKPKLNLSGEVQLVSENLMKDMLKEFNNENKYYNMIIRADLLKLLSIVAREYSSITENKDTKDTFDRYRSAITDTIKYIHDNFAEELHLEDICKYSMMSKTYFSYIFKELTGKTFTEYLISLRVQKAMELLVDTDMSTTKICYEVGFNDVTHFCRTFKKIVGVSPKYYKKATI